MRTINYLLLLTSVFIASCGDEPAAPKTPPEPAITPQVTEIKTAEPVLKNAAISKEKFDAGWALVSNSDCKGCHGVYEKNIGPAYLDVANKYPIDKSTTASLAEKIIKGGQGVWGQIPMNAHPSLSTEDAIKMVEFIQGLKAE